MPFYDNHFRVLRGAADEKINCYLHFLLCAVCFSSAVSIKFMQKLQDVGFFRVPIVLGTARQIDASIQPVRASTEKAFISQKITSNS